MKKINDRVFKNLRKRIGISETSKLQVTPENGVDRFTASIAKKKTKTFIQRTIPPRKKSIRVELEGYVIAWNTILKDKVGSMDIITLMRNTHPSYRPSFATALVEAGLMGDFEAGEFKVGSTPRQHSRLN